MNTYFGGFSISLTFSCIDTFCFLKLNIYVLLVCVYWVCACPGMQAEVRGQVQEWFSPLTIEVPELKFTFPREASACLNLRDF